MSRAALAVLAALALAAFVFLGNAVSHQPPGALDRTVHDALVGRAVPFAALLTRSGRFPAYAALCVAALVFGFVRRAWLARALLSIGLLIAADVASNVFKDHFGRLRPPHQLVFFETSPSYGSGHATLSLAFYGGWAVFAWHADLPRFVRLAIVAAAAVAILGVSWSRLALGAHWLTDVVGGWLLGAAFLAVQAAYAAPVASPEVAARRTAK